MSTPAIVDLTMKLAIDKMAFLAALAPAAAATRRGGQNPTEHVLIAAGDGLLSFTGTNNILTMTRSAPVIVDEPGRVVVMAKALQDISTLMPPGSIEVTAAQPWITLRSLAPKTKVSVRIQAFEASVFPLVDKVPDEPGAPIPVDRFRALIEGVLYAASDDEHRPHLISVHAEHDAGRIVVVATDGHRLAKASADIRWPAMEEHGINMPARSLLTLLRHLEDGQDVEMQLVEGGAFAVFRSGPLRVVMKLSPHTFPPWRPILPKDYVHTCSVSRADVQTMLDRALAMAVSKTHSTGLCFEREPSGAGVLKISVDNPDRGALSDGVVDGVVCRGNGVRQNVNAAYISEAVAHLAGDTITFQMNGSLDVARITGDSAAGIDSESFVMPMNC